jgi:hypothetical protein
MKTEGTFDAQANILWELLKKKNAASNFNFYEIALKTSMSLIKISCLYSYKLMDKV